MELKEALDILTRIEEETKQSVAATDRRITGKAIQLQERIDRFMTAVALQDGPDVKANIPNYPSTRDTALYQPFRDFELFVRSYGAVTLKMVSAGLSFTKDSMEMWYRVGLPKEEVEKFVAQAVDAAEKFRDDTTKGWSNLVDEEFKEMRDGLEKILYTFATSKENVENIFSERNN